MSEQNETQKDPICEIRLPDWYIKFSDNFSKSKKDISQEVANVEIMDKEILEKYIGGSIEELPYEALQVLLPNGSDDDNVGDILREKRTNYLKIHPEMSKSKNSDGHIIAFDGRIIPMADWLTATDSEKRAILVGSTCFHYNSDTPGMDSNPKDRY